MVESAEDFIKRKKEDFEKVKKQGSSIPFKDIGRQGKWHFIREAATFMKQHNYSNKVFVIERLRKESISGRINIAINWKKGDIEYRIGYYVVGKIGRAKNKWVWGQYCPLIPSQDFHKLFLKARKEGTIKR